MYTWYPIFSLPPTCRKIHHRQQSRLHVATWRFLSCDTRNLLSSSIFWRQSSFFSRFVDNKNNNKIFPLSLSSSSPKLSQSILLQQPYCLPNSPQSKQRPFFVCSACLFHSMVTLVSMSWGKERMRTCRLRGGFATLSRTYLCCVSWFCCCFCTTYY